MSNLTVVTSGMIPASGAGGSEFDSRVGPQFDIFAPPSTDAVLPTSLPSSKKPVAVVLPATVHFFILSF